MSIAHLTEHFQCVILLHSLSSQIRYFSSGSYCLQIRHIWELCSFFSPSLSACVLWSVLVGVSLQSIWLTFGVLCEPAEVIGSGVVCIWGIKMGFDGGFFLVSPPGGSWNTNSEEGSVFWGSCVREGLVFGVSGNVDSGFTFEGVACEFLVVSSVWLVLVGNFLLLISPSCGFLEFGGVPSCSMMGVS